MTRRPRADRRTPWGTSEAEYDREIITARNNSIANLRQAADHQRVEILARQIHATLQGESRADSTLAMAKVFGVWLGSCETLGEAATIIAVITRLIADEVVGPPGA